MEKYEESWPTAEGRRPRYYMKNVASVLGTTADTTDGRESGREVRQDKSSLSLRDWTQMYNKCPIDLLVTISVYEDKICDAILLKVCCFICEELVNGNRSSNEYI